jgi:hypothetical protein
LALLLQNGNLAQGRAAARVPGLAGAEHGRQSSPHSLTHPFIEPLPQGSVSSRERIAGQRRRDFAFCFPSHHEVPVRYAAPSPPRSLHSLRTCGASCPGVEHEVDITYCRDSHSARSRIQRRQIPRAATLASTCVLLGARKTSSSTSPRPVALPLHFHAAATPVSEPANERTSKTPVTQRNLSHIFQDDGQVRAVHGTRLSLRCLIASLHLRDGTSDRGCVPLLAVHRYLMSPVDERWPRKNSRETPGPAGIKRLASISPSSKAGIPLVRSSLPLTKTGDGAPSQGWAKFLKSY